MKNRTALNLQSHANTSEPGREFLGQLDELPRYVTRLLNSPKLPANLIIKTKRSGAQIFYRSEAEPLELQLMASWIDVERVAAIRAFLKEQAVFKQEHIHGGACVFCCPLPPISEQVSGLIIEVMRRVFRLDNDAETHFVFVH